MSFFFYKLIIVDSWGYLRFTENGKNELRKSILDDLGIILGNYIIVLLIVFLLDEVNYIAGPFSLASCMSIHFIKNVLFCAQVICVFITNVLKYALREIENYLIKIKYNFRYVCFCHNFNISRLDEKFWKFFLQIWMVTIGKEMSEI